MLMFCPRQNQRFAFGRTFLSNTSIPICQTFSFDNLLSCHLFLETQITIAISVICVTSHWLCQTQRFCCMISKIFLPSHVIFADPVNIIHSAQHKRILATLNMCKIIWNHWDSIWHIKPAHIKNLKNVDVLRYRVITVSIFWVSPVLCNVVCLFLG